MKVTLGDESFGKIKTYPRLMVYKTRSGGKYLVLVNKQFISNKNNVTFIKQLTPESIAWDVGYMSLNFTEDSNLTDYTGPITLEND